MTSIVVYLYCIDINMPELGNSKVHKVMMFGWEFAPYIAGGLGVVCRSITESLVEDHGYKVTYVLPRMPAGLSPRLGGISLKGAGIDFKYTQISLSSPYSTDIANPALGNIYARQELNSADRPNESINSIAKPIYGNMLEQEVEAYASQAAQIASLEKYDVIHNHDWMTAQAAIIAKEDSGKPMVMHMHATEIERTLGNPNPFIFAKELEGMNHADMIIAVSQATKDRIVSNYGISPEKITVVHNALDKLESKYGPLAKSIYNDDKVVLFLARLTAMKGANYLLDAAPKVLKVLPKTKFLFVGAGELLENLIEQSIDLGISHKVSFTGFLPHDQIDRAYRKADVFVMPSVAEPFGITPLEAIRNGTPVIISKQSGASEVLQNVLKVDFWDVDEMANKLIAVLKYGVLADELTNNSKHDLEKLSWDKQTEQIMNVYDQLKVQQAF